MVIWGNILVTCYRCRSLLQCCLLCRSGLGELLLQVDPRRVLVGCSHYDYSRLRWYDVRCTHFHFSSVFSFSSFLRYNFLFHSFFFLYYPAEPIFLFSPTNIPPLFSPPPISFTSSSVQYWNVEVDPFNFVLCGSQPSNLMLRDAIRQKKRKILAEFISRFSRLRSPVFCVI